MKHSTNSLQNNIYQIFSKKNVLFSITLCSVVFVTQNTPVFAQTVCHNPQNQSQMNHCAAESAISSDKKLTQIYQQLKSSLHSPQQKSLLNNTQLIWLKFRDSQCNFERSFVLGGTIAPTIYYSCFKELTEQRIKHLSRNQNSLF
jgi:uncharacterized protein YecT (DUF1311 family)